MYPTPPPTFATRVPSDEERNTWETTINNLQPAHRAIALQYPVTPWNVYADTENRKLFQPFGFVEHHGLSVIGYAMDPDTKDVTTTAARPHLCGLFTPRTEEPFLHKLKACFWQRNDFPIADSEAMPDG